MSKKREILEKYRRCILEYTNAAGAYNLPEEGEEPMGGDPAAMGGDPAAMGGDPAAMGGDPAAMGGDPAAMGGDPAAMGGGAEGFEPEGGDQNGGIDGMGGDPAAMGGDPAAMGGDTMQDNDEVIDVDELVKSQETAEKKIDKMNDKFEKLMGAIESLITQNKEQERREMEAKADFKAEIEKRLPTPQQRMTMRSTKSSPYSMSPNEYMNNYAPENYSDEDDNNGADDMQYKITKGDIDSFTDYNSIAKELDIEHQGLRDILGF